MKFCETFLYSSSFLSAETSGHTLAVLLLLYLNTCITTRLLLIFCQLRVVSTSLISHVPTQCCFTLQIGHDLVAATSAVGLPGTKVFYKTHLAVLVVVCISPGATKRAITRRTHVKIVRWVKSHRSFKCKWSHLLSFLKYSQNVITSISCIKNFGVTKFTKFPDTPILLAI